MQSECKVDFGILGEEKSARKCRAAPQVDDKVTYENE